MAMSANGGLCLAVLFQLLPHQRIFNCFVLGAYVNAEKPLSFFFWGGGIVDVNKLWSINSCTGNLMTVLCIIVFVIVVWIAGAMLWFKFTRHLSYHVLLWTSKCYQPVSQSRLYTALLWANQFCCVVTVFSCIQCFFMSSIILFHGFLLIPMMIYTSVC